jgi:hypothetical protein
MLARGADGPPDEAGILDGAGLHHHIQIAFVVGCALEDLRQAGARQLAIGRKAVAHQAGAVALPERRGGGQRQQRRQIGQDAAHDADATVLIGHLDMDMHSADLVARADHLQITHDPVIGAPPP